MAEERRDPVWLDDVESSPEPRLPRRLCIISGDALPSGEFIAALQTAVGSNQEIEIIRERRRGGSGTPPGHPPIDRRRLPHVEAMVKMDGFAIVPVPASQSRPASPSWPPRESEPPRSPFARRALDEDSQADERELERILQFKRRHRVRLGLPLLAAALMGVLVLFLVQLPAVKTLMSRTARQAATPPAEQTGGPLQSPQAPAPATPSSPDPSGASSPSASRESGERASVAADSGSLPAAQVSPAPRSQVAPAPRAQTSPVPRAGTTETRPPTANGTVAGLPSAAPGRVSPRPTAAVGAAETLRGETARFPGVPLVELTRSSLPTADGKANAYIVRVSDPGGRPLAGAEVLLLAGMADGTVESIMLYGGSEPGTYSGASRPGRSAPVDLRVRMTMSDKRIEIPLRP